MHSVPAPTAARRSDLWSGLAVFGLTAVAFWPVSRWVIVETLRRDQFKNALIVLVAAIALTVWRHRALLAPQPRWSLLAGALLAAAYGGLALAATLRAGWLMLPGGIAALAAAGVFLFGRSARPVVAWVAVGAAGFIIVLLAFPLLDWPLRQMSGVYSAHLLGFIGLTPHLSVVGQGEATRLLLQVDGRIFEVATECNGFGTIAASTLLALMLALPAREPWWWKILLVPGAAAAGMVINLVRILVICLLAPVFPRHYWAMHETIGVIALWSALLLVWWLSTPRNPAPPSAPAGPTAG